MAVSVTFSFTALLEEGEAISIDRLNALIESVVATVEAEVETAEIADGAVTAAKLDLSGLTDYADDAAAEVGGVPVGGVYRTGSEVKVRVS